MGHRPWSLWQRSDYEHPLTQPKWLPYSGAHQEGELAEIWKACLPDDHGRIVRLLILTGQRRTESGDLEWPEINRPKRQIDLPDTRTKNRRPHIVPLSNEALAIIKAIPRRDGRDLIFGSGAGGFSGWSKAKAELNARIAAARVEAQPSAESMPSLDAA